MHPAPPAPSTSTQSISASTQLSETASLSNIWTKILHVIGKFPQTYVEKIKGSSFCQKIGAHSISRMLIRNPDLDFLNFDPDIYFWANLGPKIQSCLFCLKIVAYNISRMLILNPVLDFWNSEPKTYFWANLVPKIQSENWCT